MDVWGCGAAGGTGTGALDAGADGGGDEAVRGVDPEPQAANTKAMSTSGRGARGNAADRRPAKTVVNLATAASVPARGRREPLQREALQDLARVTDSGGPG